MAVHPSKHKGSHKKERHRLLGISVKKALAGQLRRKASKEKNRT